MVFDYSEEWAKIQNEIKEKQIFFIGIAGRARSGKDYFGEFIRDELPGSRTYSLADSLKSTLRVQGLMTDKDAPLCQYMGTEVYRQKEAGIWIRVLCYKILEDAPKFAIIKDCRFHNEILFCKVFGIVVRVRRIDENGNEYIDPSRNFKHDSENLFGFDHPSDYSMYVTAKSGDIDTLQLMAKRAAGIAERERKVRYK